jgi:non-ribosomal peptide synthetase-like protein
MYDRRVDGFVKADGSSRSDAETAMAASEVERGLAEVLADVVSAESVSVDSHFFDDLGADSMVMARFCARVRKREDLPSVSMPDIYSCPTIRSLAMAHAGLAPAAVEPPVVAPSEVSSQVGTLQYVVCGTLQLLFFLGYSYVVTLVMIQGIEWISDGGGFGGFYARSIVFVGVTFLGLCTLPIVAKWVLIGRWRRQRIRVWSLAYLRFWVVKTLVRSSPLVLFVGSPLYVLYLRALGAKIGRGVAIFANVVPVCTDLLTIGEGTVIRKDALLTCYRAQGSVIETGAVTLGRDVLVGVAGVLDIDTSMGDGAQLGHSSSLHAGQVVPDGERRHGSPAQRTEVDFRSVDPIGCGTVRRAAYPVLQLLGMLVLLPLVISVVIALLSGIPQVGALLHPAPLALTSWSFYLHALVACVVVTGGALLGGLVVVVIVPRVLSVAVKPDKVYRLYGFHYWLQRVIARMTNVSFFTYLFGDSVGIVNYLHGLGYKLLPTVQTGSNFGMQLKHDDPYLTSVGSGTMVADGLSVINAEYSSSSFRLSRVSIGRRNFLGNNIVYPARGRTGENCLLATRVMVPIDGEVREGVGLLGSPSFEIPRSVERDMSFVLPTADDFRRRLAAKTRHNVVTMGLYLLVVWGYSLLATLLVGAAVDLYNPLGPSMIALTSAPVLLVTVAYFALVARLASLLQVLAPLGCSIYDCAFWRHERFWKLAVLGSFPVFNGTPVKSGIWRLLGVRVGARLFDNGCEIVEKTFVTIGDSCTLNERSAIQAHSQEDGAFKSDRITIGSGCTIGVGAWVHYGVLMGDGAELAPDSFLMKGEEVPPHTRWAGNPASEMRVDRERATVVPDDLPRRT